MNFSDFGLHGSLLRGVEDLGFVTATPIQTQSIPAGMEGRDLLAAAMTGSGKTAAFLLPIMHRLLAKPRGTTRALILTPTRELAAQIHEHLVALAKHTNLTGAAVFGGVGMGPQDRAFRTGVDVIIATPGRLLDHLRSGTARFDKLDVLVLDEADRMLDMGFLPDVRRILGFLPKERQTLFFSATMPTEIQRLSKEMLKNAVAFNVERKAAPATGVTQKVFPVAGDGKSALLLELLRRGDLGSVIVFSRTKHRTNRLSDYLEKHGVANARIHGNRSQHQRIEALAAFKAGEIRVLCATDIVARGIDVEQLEHVVNFDVPHMPEDYIHRVGRTARAEATGEAYTFVSREEESDLAAIERAIGKRLERVTLADFDYSARPAEKLEIPLAERIAAIRARKGEERQRAQEKAARRAPAVARGTPSTNPGSRAGVPRASIDQPERPGQERTFRERNQRSGFRPGGNRPQSDRPQSDRRDGAPSDRRDGPPSDRRDGPWGNAGPRRDSAPRRDEPARAWGQAAPAGQTPAPKPAFSGHAWDRWNSGESPRPRSEDSVEVSPGIWRRKPGSGGR